MVLGMPWDRGVDNVVSDMRGNRVGSRGGRTPEDWPFVVLWPEVKPLMGFGHDRMWSGG